MNKLSEKEIIKYINLLLKINFNSMGYVYGEEALERFIRLIPKRKRNEQEITNLYERIFNT